MIISRISKKISTQATLCKLIEYPVNMKKIFLVFSLLFIGLTGLSAQEADSLRRDKMVKEVQEFKMNYLAQQMELTEAQKKKFFEVYEEMEKARHLTYRNAVKLNRSLKKNKDASEDEYQKVTEAFNHANLIWAEQEKTYNEKFSEFLSPKQIYKLREAENSYRAKLDEMKSSRKKDRHPKPKEKK